MPTTLRMGFAMGGGVSLGTFCGAALTQAIKLVLLYGEDRHHEPYDKVEIDVFSGASAGALSLAAMLRYLLDRTADQERRARGKLEDEFGSGVFAGLSPCKVRDLIAAQVVQDMQKQLWSKEITLPELLGENGDGKLPQRASILDRGAVDRIARDHMLTWKDGLNFDKRCLVADRVIFACSLANLSPVIADASPNLPGPEVGYVGLADGMRSHTHRDMRIFDLYFHETPDPEGFEHPGRWCRYHVGEEVEGKIGDLRQKKSWARIAATAIASGAFPLAFEPVVLKRKAYEFGKKLWTKTFGVPESGYDGQDAFLFSYVDGGTFNNEPIREAFRLASFVDGHNPRDKNTDRNSSESDDGSSNESNRKKDEGNDVERLIVFVDPFVSEAVPAFNLPVHREWDLRKPSVASSMEGGCLFARASLDRLIPHVGTLLGAISNQSRVIEADKVFQVRNCFELRKEVREVLHGSLKTEDDEECSQRLDDFIRKRLSASKEDEMIPPGPLTIEKELARVISEEVRGDHPEWEPLLERIEDYVKNPPSPQSPDSGRWLRALAFSAVDLMFGLEGKHEHAKLVAIAPLRNLGSTTPEKIHLPGGLLSGFAGFMSEVPDDIEYRAARYCAAEFLKECEVLKPETPLPDVGDLELNDQKEKQLEGEIKAGLDRLAERVEQMIRDSHQITILPVINALLKRLLGKYAGDFIRNVDWKEERKTSCEFRIATSVDGLEFDGHNVADRYCRPVRIPDTGDERLVMPATFLHSSPEWSGDFVVKGEFELDRHMSDFEFRDRDFCWIELPKKDEVEEARRKPQALFELCVKKEDEGLTVEGDRWEPRDGVIPLRDELIKGDSG